MRRANQRKYRPPPPSRRSKVIANADFDQADANPQNTEQTLKYVMILSPPAMEMPEPGEAKALMKLPPIATMT